MAISSTRRFEFDLKIRKYRTEFYDGDRKIQAPKEVLEEELNFIGLKLKSAIYKLVDLLSYDA